MGPKRGQTTQLQTPILNDEQLFEWLKHEGLGLIDVYSEWCGPCIAMAPYLKKIKLEIVSGNLSLATAKSDTVEAIRRFSGRSEPTWIFTSRGKLIRLFYGANYPRLYEAIQHELKLQEQADAGHDTRTYTDIAALTAEEQVIADIKSAEAERQAAIELEESLRKIEERRVEVASAVAGSAFNETVLIIWPKFALDFKKLNKLRKFWEDKKFDIKERKVESLTEEVIENFQRFAGFDLSSLATKSLLSGKAALWLMKYTSEMIEDSIEELFSKLLYGSSGTPPGDPESIAEQFFHIIPYPTEELTEEEDIELGVTVEEEVEEEENILPKSTSVIKNPIKEPSVLAEEVEEEIEGELAPGLWTPLNPIALARGTVYISLFNETAFMFIPPEIPPIPPHIAMIFPGDMSQKVVDTIHQYKFIHEILNYGFFVHEESKEPELVATSFLEYKKKELHEPDEVLILAVAQKKSFASITLAELGPKYVSDNWEKGENDCAKWFGGEFVQGTEVDVEEEGEIEEEDNLDLEEEDEEEEVIYEENEVGN